MIALIRYQLSLLLRSHRWIPPAVLFVLGVAGLGGVSLPHGAGLSQGLAWSALMLVPVEAWLTRSMLTAEPAAARACVAAAGGPRRTQVAALIAAVAAGAAFGILGVLWEVLSLGVPRLGGDQRDQGRRHFLRDRRRPDRRADLPAGRLGDRGCPESAGDQAASDRDARHDGRRRARAGLERVAGERGRPERGVRVAGEDLASWGGVAGRGSLARGGLGYFGTSCRAPRGLTFGLVAPAG